MLDPARDARLFARWGAVRTTREGLAIAASFGFEADQHTAEDIEPAPMRPSGADAGDGHRSSALH